MVLPKIVSVLKWFFRKGSLYLAWCVCQVDLLKSKEMLLQTTRTLTQGIVDGRPVGVTTKKTTDQHKQRDFSALFDAMEAEAQLHKSNTGMIKT